MKPFFLFSPFLLLLVAEIFFARVANEWLA